MNGVKVEAFIFSDNEPLVDEAITAMTRFLNQNGITNVVVATHKVDVASTI